MGNPKEAGKFHIAMFPWFAMGHLTPYLHLSNQLAERGHKISFLLPTKAQLRLQHLNRHPNLIAFHPISVPPVDGLPPSTETAADVPKAMVKHLATAMDLTRDQVEISLRASKPDFVFYDIAHWVPELAKEIGFKSVCYKIVSPAALGISLVPAFTAANMSEPPPGYPSTTVVFRPHETVALSFLFKEFGSGITFYDRVTTAMKNCDAIAIRTCSEIEGSICNYVANQYQKPLLLTGPVMSPQPAGAQLEPRWAEWLQGFEPGSVIYCALGSEISLEKSQFQELLLGLKQTNLPFLAAIKPPQGCATVEEAFPDGFEGARGVVHGGWVQQTLILAHPSVGCFVSHCGFGSMWESLINEPQIVLLPYLGDHILNTRLLCAELKVGVEVERDEKGLFTKEGISMAIRSVMDKESEVGCLVKKNHASWKKLLTPRFMDDCVDKFVDQLYQL